MHHYFGTKDDLFVAALELPVDPREAIAPALVGGPDGAGERMLRVFVGVWDDPANTPRLRRPAPGRCSTRRPATCSATGSCRWCSHPVGRALGLDRPDLRMSLVASQLIGIILGRYVLALEPLASLSADAVVATYAPTIQRYLTGDRPADRLADRAGTPMAPTPVRQTPRSSPGAGRSQSRSDPATSGE